MAAKGGRKPVATLALTLEEVERITKRRVSFIVAMRERGVDGPAIAKVIKDALGANVTERRRKKSGKGYEDVTLVDHRTRLHAAEVAARLQSLEPPKTIEKNVHVEHGGGVVMLPEKDPPRPPPIKAEPITETEYKLLDEGEDDDDDKL